MVLLNNDEFLSSVKTLAAKVRKDSSFTITFKKYDGIDKPKPRDGKVKAPTENLCIIRMKAKNDKISTVVKHEDVPRIMETYGKVLKANMDGLKKVKRNKNKSKAAAVVPSKDE